MHLEESIVKVGLVRTYIRSLEVWSQSHVSIGEDEAKTQDTHMKQPDCDNPFPDSHVFDALLCCSKALLVR